MDGLGEDDRRLIRVALQWAAATHPHRRSKRRWEELALQFEEVLT